MVRQRIAVVVDTNIYFSALYKPTGNEGRLLTAAGEGNPVLISPDTVREELQRNLVGKLGYAPPDARALLHLLPTVWLPREEYQAFLPEARQLVRWAPDSPVLAAALALGALLLTGDRRHFAPAAVRRKVRVVTSPQLLQLLQKLG